MTKLYPDFAKVFEEINVCKMLSRDLESGRIESVIPSTKTYFYGACTALAVLVVLIGCDGWFFKKCGNAPNIGDQVVVGNATIPRLEFERFHRPLTRSRGPNSTVLITLSRRAD